MRNNLVAIDKAIGAFNPGPKDVGRILYESAAEGYKDWNRCVEETGIRRRTVGRKERGT